MNKTALKTALLLLLICFLLAGLTACWSSVEPKNVALTNSVLYHFNEDENKFTTTAQLEDLGAADPFGGGGETLSITIKGSGKTPESAYADMSCCLERMITGSHAKARFLTDKLAANDYAMTTLLSYLARSEHADQKPYIFVISQENSEKLFETQIGFQAMVGDYIGSLAEIQPKENSKGVYTTTFDFIKDYYRAGIEPVGGLAKIEKAKIKASGGENQGAEDENYALKIEGAAVFNGVKMVGELNGNETRIYNILTNKSQFSVEEFENESNFVSVNILKPNTKIKTVIVDGVAHVEINVKAKATLNYSRLNKDAKDDYQKNLAFLKGEAEKSLINEIETTIKRVQEDCGSDIFGFGYALHTKNPTQWKTVESDWNSHFKNAKVTVKCTLDLNRNGQIL
jgi:spore germination protein KC